MSLTLTVEAKVAGRKRPLLSNWRLAMPPVEGKSGRSLRLRDLISLVVAEEVEAYHARGQERRLARMMSRTEVEQGARDGKVDPGGREPGARVQVEDAIATALQAFEDGLYFVFLDEVQQTDLEGEVYLHSDSKLVFLRLTALAGG